MDLSIIFCYKTDNEGNNYSDEDLFHVKVTKRISDKSTLLNSGELNIVLDDLDSGETVKFDVIQLKYSGAEFGSPEELFDYVLDNFDTLIDEGSLVTEGQFDCVFTVQND